MEEHVIRLRAAWEAETRYGTGAEALRVDLPTVWPAHLTTPFRLNRTFQTPPRLDRADRICLRLDRVPGVTRLALNGHELPVPGASVTSFEINLSSALAARNRIELDVDPGQWGACARETWGEIALVIRPGFASTNGGLDRERV